MTKINTQTQRLKTRIQRFEEKIDKSGDCWNWQSAIGSRGYGVFWHGSERRSVFAHRFSYELATGEIPEPGLVVMHSCDNPRCVNPAHLSVGTILDNALDASQKNRIAHGERNGGGRKLTESQVAEIKATAGTIGCTLAAKRYGVSSQTIKAIRRGKIWNRVGLHVNH